MGVQPDVDYTAFPFMSHSSIKESEHWCYNWCGLVKPNDLDLRVIGMDVPHFLLGRWGKDNAF